MTLYVAPVVEGHTEQSCLERLLHRVWKEILDRSAPPRVIEPFRAHRDELVKPDGVILANTAQKAFQKLSKKSASDSTAVRLLLVLIDAEGDCPASLAPRLLKTVKAALPSDASVACVLPKRMLENWILAGASTLAGVNNLPATLPDRDRFEERNGAAWLDDQIRSLNASRKYKKTVDAEAFIRSMDLKECRTNSPSFDKLCRDLDKCCPISPTKPETSESNDGKASE